MKTILIVDDMAVLRQPIAAMLEQSGYRVVQASDGLEALEQFNQHPPDLILTDLAMPRMDGRAFLQEIHASGKPLPPVILFTAVTDKDYVVGTAKLGIKDYMLKSRFSLEDLLAKIRKFAPPEPGAGGAPEAPAVSPTNTAGGSEAGADQTHGADASRASSSGTDSGRPKQAPLQSSLKAYDPLKPMADYIKELSPIISKPEMEQHIENCRELKAMSPTVAQILKITGSRDSSLDQVTRAVKQDQAIALKILKLANSAIYSRGKTVESVQQAVMNIGMDQIRQVALNIAVIDSFLDQGDGRRVIDPILFWEHSIAVGLIASNMAKFCGRPAADVEAAFTMGLLHDIGRMVMIEQFPDLYRRVTDVAEHVRILLEVAEFRMLGIPHTDLVERVLQNWRFPAHLITPIAMHHLALSNIRASDKDIVFMAHLIALSNRLAHALCLGSSGNNALYPFDDLVASVKLKQADLDRLIESIPNQTYDLKMAMLRNTDQLDPPDYLALLTKSWPQDVLVTYVNREQSPDCYEIMLRRIGVLTSPDMTPNLIIARMNSAADRVPVGMGIRKIDESGGGRLPCLMISPKGNIYLEDALLAGRETASVPSPTPIQRLLDAAHCLAVHPAVEPATAQ